MSKRKYPEHIQRLVGKPRYDAAKRYDEEHPDPEQDDRDPGASVVPGRLSEMSRSAFEALSYRDQASAIRAGVKVIDLGYTGLRTAAPANPPVAPRPALKPKGARA